MSETELSERARATSEAQEILTFEERKRAHIAHSLREENQAFGHSGLAQIRLIHEALPSVDFDEISISAPLWRFQENIQGAFKNPTLATPFYIAGMTAGHPDALLVNERLATACAERGWAMGVGSQRKELGAENGSSEWIQIREKAPNAVLFGNIGITQLQETTPDTLVKLVENIKASALCIHLNALQEALQPEGTPRFQNAETLLAQCAEALAREGIPVVVKETGCGFSPTTLKRLHALKLAAIDVSGLGGTHWGRIEGRRAEKSDGMRARAAETFANWGVSTVDSVKAASEILVASASIWASGGVRSGLDAAKLIALGAHRVGYAKPALEKALEGPEALSEWMKQQEFELRLALFCTGCRDVSELSIQHVVASHDN